MSRGGGVRRSRGQPEPGRRGDGAAPSATQRPLPGAHGAAGGAGAAGASPSPVVPPPGRPRFVRVPRPRYSQL